MDEYISKQAFKEKYLCCGWLPEMSNKEFDDFPAADVALVVHGEWMDTPNGTETICSYCKADWNVFDNDTYRFNYCPNCGAKMDGGESDGKT